MKELIADDLQNIFSKPLSEYLGSGSEINYGGTPRKNEAVIISFSKLDKCQVKRFEIIIKEIKK